VVFVEGVGDVFEDDEAEDDVLVWLRLLPPLVAVLGNRRVHVVAELVGGEPEFGFEAEFGGGVGGSGFSAGHGGGEGGSKRAAIARDN